jgi:hypothetical protein
MTLTCPRFLTQLDEGIPLGETERPATPVGESPSNIDPIGAQECGCYEAIMSQTGLQKQPGFLISVLGEIMEFKVTVTPVAG